MIDDGLNLLLIASGDVGQKPNGLLKEKFPKNNKKAASSMKFRESDRLNDLSTQSELGT